MSGPIQKLSLDLPIRADAKFKFDRNRVRKAVEQLLVEHKLWGKVIVSLSVVGDRKMRELKRKYYGVDETTDVLSFSQSEGEMLPADTDDLILGDVVVSYPQAKRQALEYYKSLDEEIEFLVCHGVLHLLGIHHD